MEDVPYKRSLPQTMDAGARHCGCSDLPLLLAPHFFLDEPGTDTWKFPVANYGQQQCL